MNINQLFNKFKSNIPEEEILIDFSTHPLYWIGGFIKIHSNKEYFIQYIIKILKKEKQSFSIETATKTGLDLMFEKSWNFIKLIDINNLFHVECLRLKVDTLLLENIKDSIYHFEKLEEYEKCNHLKNIQLKILEFFP